MTNYLFRSTRWFQCCNDFLLQFLNLMGLRSPPIYLSYEHISCAGTWCMVFWGIANLQSLLTIAIQGFSIGKNFHLLGPLLDWTRWSYKLIVDLVQKPRKSIAFKDIIDLLSCNFMQVIFICSKCSSRSFFLLSAIFLVLCLLKFIVAFTGTIPCMDM